jgi:hypothetical protein
VQIVRNLSLTYIISWGESGPISCKHIVQTCFVPFFTVCNLRLIFILYQKWNVTFSAINVNRHSRCSNIYNLYNKKNEGWPKKAQFGCCCCDVIIDRHDTVKVFIGESDGSKSAFPVKCA